MIFEQSIVVRDGLQGLKTSEAGIIPWFWRERERESYIELHRKTGHNRPCGPREVT